MLSTSNPLVRGFDASLDGAADDAAATRYTVITGERICGWSCDPSSPHYEKDHHMCPAHCGGGEARRRWREKHATLDATCPPPPPAAPLVRSGPPPRCSDSAAQLTAAGVFLLVGVQSGPSERHLARRNAIRHSWIRWENVGRTVLVCFLLGRRELRPGALRRLEAEAAENGDVLWLTNATDEGVPTLKGYEWWRTAASLLPADSGGGGIAHFAKVDDDSFVHLINLEADLRRLWVRRRRAAATAAPTARRPPARPARG